ncbi:MAG: agmatine deiminase family protein [Cyanobacteriota bacterium SKYGB_h_bin112]|nr:agmatine deiminase family protein [Cyanobacteriota bacterium SKYGB_h_bin112]
MTIRFYQPAEWHPHSACWLAFPSHVELWDDLLPAARAEFVELCRAIADPDPVTGEARGEQLEILVLDADGQAIAEQMLGTIPARFHHHAFGDIWMRDIAPIFLVHPTEGLATVRFQFNGWGDRYHLPGDDTVAPAIARWVDAPEFTIALVAEGGALEVDGEGTCLTTRQCLLNPNRNPHLTQDEVERLLHMALGVSKVIWLQEGLLNDHTDGHIDTLARFVAPGVVVCMEAQDPNDPNRDTLNQVATDLAKATDASGRRLHVIRIPSPGPVLDHQGNLMPASYVNFYIGNRSVVVPTYGTAYDDAAVAAIASCFPTRRTIGLSAKAILAGGGAFHCITQQQPSV